MEKSRIFVVEDEPILAQHIQEFLSSENFSVVGVADSAEDAFPLILKKLPEILLVDVNLKKGGNGIDLAEAVKRYIDIPIVFLTASTDHRTLDRIKRLNAYGFVIKPFDEAQLKIVLELALSKHQQEKIRNAHLATEDFFYYLSHSFRGSLARILGLTNLFKYEVNDKKALLLNDLVEKNAKKIDELLTNYLQYITTIDNKEIRFLPIDWRKILEEVITDLNFLELNVPSLPTISLIVKEEFLSDPFLIKVVLTQLLKNALDYREEIASIQIVIIEQENFFQLKVLDKGIGMDEVSQAKCFNLYFRGTEKSEGIGIGLNLAQKAVGKLCGKIGVVSVKDKGTYVSVMLPKVYKNMYLQQQIIKEHERISQ